jgi:hypothetical protein
MPGSPHEETREKFSGRRSRFVSIGVEERLGDGKLRASDQLPVRLTEVLNREVIGHLFKVE